MTEQLSTLQQDRKIMPANWPGELKAILALGTPMAATQLVQFLVYTIDVVMIARVSADALAASSLGLVVMFLLWMIGSGAANHFGRHVYRARFSVLWPRPAHVKNGGRICSYA